MKTLPTNQATISHPLFQILNDEHARILNILSKLDISTSNHDLLLLSQELQSFAEIQHHEKEEKLLFTAIYENKKIHEGGPRCSLYFDLHIFENTKAQVEKIIGHALTRTAHQSVLLEKQTPLTIPIEEHQSGRELLVHILNRLHNNEDFLENKKKLEFYKSIQINHINKEKNCLYHMCAQLLSKESADEILTTWIKDI